MLSLSINEYYSLFKERINELKEGDVCLGYEKYYVFTIKISHDDVIELYDIKFIVQPSPQEINNGDEICVSVYGVNKNIYKLI